MVRYYEGLPQIRANAAGMDIGAEEIWVDVGNKDVEGVRRFGTFTADLNEMAEWLKQCGIETVAMESTGVYWIAPFQILEAKGIEVFLVNARFVKNVQGRKTDMLDCQWIRLLHSYGLLPKSFRPAAQIAVLRSYLRHRQMLIQYAASHIQHMQKALTQMNVQIHHVISDIRRIESPGPLAHSAASRRLRTQEHCLKPLRSITRIAGAMRRFVFMRSKTAPS